MCVIHLSTGALDTVRNSSTKEVEPCSRARNCPTCAHIDLLYVRGTPTPMTKPQAATPCDTLHPRTCVLHDALAILAPQLPHVGAVRVCMGTQRHGSNVMNVRMHVPYRCPDHGVSFASSSNKAGPAADARNNTTLAYGLCPS